MQKDVLQRERRLRKRYLFGLLAILSGGFALFLLLMFWIHTDNASFFSGIHFPFPWNVVTLAGLFTLLIAAVYNGIHMFARFIKGKSNVVKILSIVLFPVTFAAIYLIGMFGLLPYAIFSIVKLFAKRSPYKQKGHPDTPVALS